MKKLLLFTLIFILKINCYAQTIFKKGYFINNLGERTECFIKDLDWNETPSSFHYKTILTSNSSTNENLKSVKEFGIYNNVKFIKQKVDIDISSNNINQLTSNRNPIFINKEVFLKYIIEGKASLLSYKHGNLTRYFFNIDNSNIEQLIYKQYYVKENNIASNNRFQQQLWNDLKCKNSSLKGVQNLKYTKTSLTKYFKSYNNCNNSKTKNFENNKKEKNPFSLTFKAGMINSSLEIKNPISNTRDVDFGNKSGAIFSVEGEYSLPFNNNKWAITSGVAFRSFKTSIKIPYAIISGGYLLSKIDLKFIQIPIGLKHYFFLNDNSSIYLTGSYNINVRTKDSPIKFDRLNGSNYTSMDTSIRSNQSFTLGYKYSKYSIEAKYQTNIDILSDFATWNSDLSSLSFVIGYTLF